MLAILLPGPMVADPFILVFVCPGAIDLVVVTLRALTVVSVALLLLLLYQFLQVS